MNRLLAQCQTARGFTAVVRGREKTVIMRELVWIADRQELIDIYYEQAVSVSQGEYHCCLSRPGKLIVYDTI
jgi:hypothetical protein